MRQPEPTPEQLRREAELDAYIEEQMSMTDDLDLVADDPGTRRCDICGFWRARTYFTRRTLPSGARIAMCKQCGGSWSMHRKLERRSAASR